ncbi:hypothetical protein O1L44_31085 [Streptomyces noursei]|uniref:LamG-like jellyroll fold domain-containing protein n=1 Tax=Streptomyces noursei TaxID=1971 RepID=UPI00081C82B7|nr:Concanavalin A-like lectin/glucanases superfamily [Streptomyces noursei ATCC 11455]MCZ0996572.1 hypothetical protein [Streptomyces noursei]
MNHAAPSSAAKEPFLSGEQHFLKVYSDRAYVHTATVRHQGTTVALAMDDQRRIVYTVLDLTWHDEAKGELDAAYWSENPRPLRFPSEITDAGFAAIGSTALPVVKNGGRAEAAPGERLDEGEVDPFLSTTARLSALAPFHALSDGTHIVLLRQSVTADHADAVHQLAGGGSSGAPERTDYVTDRAGAKVPLAADTLLCDRFLLVGGELKPVLEARYRRSRHKDRPDSAKDSLGTTDMEGRPFREPTQALSFVRHLSGGRFTALLIPTAVHGQQRWQLFAHNDATGRIDSFNIEQGRDGLFNLQGTQIWTSPDPAHRDSVYERSPGTCPFTGQPLIPVVSTDGHAETALRFEGGEAHVHVADGPELAGRDFTVELWARRTATGGNQFLLAHGSEDGARDQSLHLGFRDNNCFTFSFCYDDLNTEQQYSDTDWHHWACVYEQATRRQVVYRDGEEVGSRTADGDYAGVGPLLLGRALDWSVRAELDEVRVWDRARTAEELRRDKGVRLIGNDPGLVAYYRFDEGSGTRLHDQTDHARHGELRGGPQWVTSEAPIGDHPGVRRDSFVVTGRPAVSGLSAVLYHQQEEVTVGYDKQAKPAKRQARVLLSYATSGPDPKTGTETDEAYLATVDFGVGRDGRLAQVPDELALPVLTAPEASTDVDAISELDTRIREAVRDIAAKEAEATDLTRRTADVPELERLRGIFYNRSRDIIGWTFRLRFQHPRDGQPQYLAVRGDGDGNDPPLIRTADKDAKSALWSIDMPPGSSWNGSMLYHLRNVHTGKDMNVAGESRDDDAPLIVYPRQPGTWNTLFGIYDEAGTGIYGPPDGCVTLVNRYSEKTVCAPDRLGDRVVQYDSAAVAATGEGLIALEYVALRQDAHPDIPDAGKRVEALDVQLAELRPQRELLATRQREITVLQAELTAAREDLARLTGGLKGADDIVLPVPQLSLDRTGLSCSGALLAFARSADRPYLLDSATGSVVLYFRGTNGQFFGTYYDTLVARASRALTADDGTAVAFTARDAGTDLAEVRITVMDVGDPGLCELTVFRGEEAVETWPRLPRRATDFAAIVNGAAGRTYDYGQVSSSRPGVPLSAGSRLVLVDPGKAAEVSLGEASGLVTGHGGRWRADKPGRAYSFDGQANHVSLPEDQLDRAAVTHDLTLESWVNPEQVSGPARIVHAHTGDVPYSLALYAPPAAATPALAFDGKSGVAITENAVNLADKEGYSRRPHQPLV